MTHFTHKRQALLIPVLLVLLTSTAWSAEPRQGSDANPADLLNPFSYAVNPALSELTLPQIAAGFQVLHWGLLDSSADLNTGGLVWTTQRSYGGLTLGANYLSTPLWGTRQLQAGYGRHVWAGLSLGVSGGINQRSFNKDRMDLSLGSGSDPLLSGSLAKTVPVFSLAASYVLPLEGVTAGVVLENPHQPSISMTEGDDSVYLPTTWRLGATWERELFQITAGLADEDLYTRFAASVRGTVFGGHGLLARLETDQWALGARISVTPKAWVEYTFTQPRSELSEVTNGTHGIVVCLHAGSRKQPKVTYTHNQISTRAYRPAQSRAGQSRLPSPQTVDVQGPETTFLHFSVAAASDTALIRTKRIRRRFKDDVDMAQVRQLPWWRIGVLDTQWSDRVTWDVTENMTVAHPESDRPSGNYSDEYRSGITALKKGLATTPDVGLVIAAEDDQLDRARYLASRVGGGSRVDRQVEIRRLQPIGDEVLRRRLMASVGQDSIPPMEEVTLFQYDAIPFHVNVLGDSSQVVAWALEIRDSNDDVVRTLSGQGPPPSVVAWDWRSASGKLVPVDSYIYQFSWRDQYDRVGRAPRREILIARQVMQRTLEFGRDQAPLNSLKNTRPVLILDPGRAGLSLGPEPVSTQSDSQQQPSTERGTEQ